MLSCTQVKYDYFNIMRDTMIYMYNTILCNVFRNTNISRVFRWETNCFRFFSLSENTDESFIRIHHNL